MEENNQGRGRQANLQPSRVLKILGPDLFAEFPAVRTESRVIWCNFELARSLGFDVPQSNQMSPELHEQLVNAFSYRALRPVKEAIGRVVLARSPLPPREVLAGRRSVTLYADKYGGDGVAPGLGSGRGGFFPYCDAFAKGIGYTPLYRHDNSSDFTHAHGGLDMHEAFTETVAGEISANLFAGKTARMLAVLDLGDSTVYPDGKLIPRAVAIRVGDQLRPAHILAKTNWARRSRLEVFLAMAKESGQLVTRDKAGHAVPDLRAILLRIIDDHARIAALQIRWRVSHLFLSASNMHMDGGMLDLQTFRSNPRLPPLPPDHSLNIKRAPYTDYVDRTSRIITIYNVLRATIPKSKQRLLNVVPVNIRKEMDHAYLEHLRRQLLCAAGLKAGMAARILREHPVLANAFVDVLMRMTQISNPANIEESKRTIADVAALDVLGLLAVYPQTFFAETRKRHAGIVERALKPVYRGNPAQIAVKRCRVRKLIAEFIERYRDLMEACSPFAVEYYGGLQNMRKSISARAAFENRPIDRMVMRPRRSILEQAVNRYRSTGDVELFNGEINHQISASLRNIDELLHQGESQILDNGGLELQILTIAGTRHAVRSWNGTEQKACVHVSSPVAQDDPFPRFRYRFTMDDWATCCDAEAGIEWKTPSHPTIACVIPQTLCTFAELQGYFYDAALKDGVAHRKPAPKQGYVFAIPDPVELAEIRSRLNVNEAESGH